MYLVPFNQLLVCATSRHLDQFSFNNRKRRVFEEQKNTHTQVTNNQKREEKFFIFFNFLTDKLSRSAGTQSGGEKKAASCRSKII